MTRMHMRHISYLLQPGHAQQACTLPVYTCTLGQEAAGMLTSPMAESYSPSTLAGSLMWKLLVSTTHWALARAQDASSMPANRLDVESEGSMALPLVEGAQGPSIITLPARSKAYLTACTGGPGGPASG